LKTAHRKLTVYLVPGFMSPAWMMVPLRWYLRRDLSDVRIWDYPRVFRDLDATLQQLAFRLDAHEEESVAIVSHSFGDWIARSALHRMQGNAVASLVSVCPVVTSVAAAKFAQKISGDLVPELAVMASEDHSEVSIPDEMSIRRSMVWARGETLIRRDEKMTGNERERRVFALHNSILFQPNGWKVIREELRAVTSADDSAA
jgi:pimeloyl-ACP methyl ester carboxylesterase